MRLFIAIELPRNVLNELSKMQSEVMRINTHRNIRPVPTQNMHLTLAFLGETNALSDAVSVIKYAARGLKPFSLHLGAADCFSVRSDGGSTAIVRIKGDITELNRLHESLTFNLKDYGFSVDGKRYVPHVTLARNAKVDADGLRTISAGNASFSVNRITLFESVRTASGMKYDALHKEAL